MRIETLYTSLLYTLEQTRKYSIQQNEQIACGIRLGPWFTLVYERPPHSMRTHVEPELVDRVGRTEHGAHTNLVVFFVKEKTAGRA